jgi:hypothetical protein
VPGLESFPVVLFRENGKWRGIHVDPYIYDSLKYHDSGTIRLAGDVLERIFLNYRLFHPLYVLYNFSFHSVNILRDFLRFYTNTPNLTLIDALKAYRKAIGPSLRRVKGEYDPLIQQAEREAALQITLNQFFHGATDEDKEILRLLNQFDPFPKNKANIRFFKPIVKIMDGIEFASDFEETLPKVAGYIHLKEKVEKMTPKERAYFTRNLIGTPGYRRKGAASPVTSALFLYSNVIKESYRGDFEVAFKDPRTRAGFWWKAVITRIIPKIVQYMAAIGLFGAMAKRIMDKAPEYIKTNYTVIPITENEDGTPIYLTIPSDEMGRFLGGLVWKTLNINRPTGISDIFAFGEGILPSVAPMLQIYLTWFQLLTGKNPRDAYRGREILTEDELAAGGIRAIKPVFVWTVRQFGDVGKVASLALVDSDSSKPLWEKVLTASPVLHRWVRTSDYGLTEKLREATIPQKQLEARRRLDIKDAVRDAIKQNTPLSKAVSQFDNVKDQREFIRLYSEEMIKSSDPVARAILQATSNDQKVQILNWLRHQFSSEREYLEYVSRLKQAKVISEDVWRRFQKEQAIR